MLIIYLPNNGGPIEILFIKKASFHNSKDAIITKTT